MNSKIVDSKVLNSEIATGTTVTRLRRLSLVLASIALGYSTSALAQPMQLPGAQPLNQAGAAVSAPPGNAPVSSAPRAPSMPSIKVAGEDAILGKTLLRNGGFGEAVFEKTATGYGLKLNARGFQASNLTEPCAISFGDTPIAVTPQGRPAGVPRYKLEASICPIVFDVLDGAFLVVEPQQPCIVEAAQCRIEPRGLWGADSRTLAPRAKEIEQSRSVAERAVREGYKVLSAKADPVEQRVIAREQAGFSAEREQICRDYQREGQYGFCGARMTEAKAASIRARLGITSDPKPARPRPRPAAPKPVPLAPTL